MGKLGKKYCEIENLGFKATPLRGVVKATPLRGVVKAALLRRAVPLEFIPRTRDRNNTIAALCGRPLKCVEGEKNHKT